MATSSTGTGSGFFRSARTVAEAAARLVRTKVLRKGHPVGAKARVKKVAKTARAATRKVASRVKAAPKKAAGSRVTEKKKASPKTARPAKAVKAAKAGKKPEKAEKKAAPKPSPVKVATPGSTQAPVARPRATKLPPVGEPLNKREVEQLLTVGHGRGVVGEGSLKGKLVVKDGFPYLHVVGRDKRELTFLLQGPDQEVLPAYVDHKVSVSGLIRKTNNYGGTVDVRKWTAKKPEQEQAAAEEQEKKLRFLSPGEIEQLCTGGMGAGLVGFARFRGTLEMTGDEFFLVVSGAGTRQQVSFLIEGKAARGLRKHVGQTLLVTGVAEKSSGWGGKLHLESFEVRPAETRAISREGLNVVHVEGIAADQPPVDVMLNGGLSVRLTERAGYTWAIEPTAAKRLGLREANFEPSNTGPATREFFFTPRNPGTFEVEFFLAKVFNPSQVAKTCKLTVNVRSQLPQA